MKVEILIGHKPFEGDIVMEIFDFPLPPGIGDTIDLSGWANIEEFEEEESFIFDSILVVHERFWYRDKKTTEVVLQLWCECED